MKFGEHIFEVVSEMQGADPEEDVFGIAQRVMRCWREARFCGFAIEFLSARMVGAVGGSCSALPRRDAEFQADHPGNSV